MAAAMTTKNHYTSNVTRKEDHIRWMKQLEHLALADSCCEICHCDCYNSHRSIDLSEVRNKFLVKDNTIYPEDKVRSVTVDKANNNNQEIFNIQEAKAVVNSVRITKEKNERAHNIRDLDRTLTTTLSSQGKTLTRLTQAQSNISFTSFQNGKQSVKIGRGKPRSKSVCSIPNEGQNSNGIISLHHNSQDCQILHNVLSSLNSAHSHMGVKRAQHNVSTQSEKPPKLNVSHTPTLQAAQVEADVSLAPVKLCESLENLCLVPTVCQAFQQIPTHDKRILNRMAAKRTEQALAKENAWLARKYWENERYEYELLKYEQMEEYKRAVRDKQFQDYLQTKSRLNEIAQRDLTELHRLRAALQHKDARTKQRLEALRTQRNHMMTSRRCNALRKIEAINLQQEEQHLDEVLRKSEICQRVTERLQRADYIRTQIMESYLKRLRYDNYIEQMHNEEHRRELQTCEQLKRKQLKEQIIRKRCKLQRFIESRQRHNAVLANAAKISASLRELVRSSVTPEGKVSFGSCGNSAVTMETSYTR